MKHIHKQTVTHLSTLCASLLLITACGGKSNYDYDQPLPVVESKVNGPIFDPANGKLPTTNDLFFRGSKDGTLNIPNAAENPLITQINTLDGFSTTNPVTAQYGVTIDPASVKLGSSVRLFEVTKNAQGAVTGVIREVKSPEVVALVAGAEKNTLALVPQLPLKENTSYLAILTKAVKAADGKPTRSPNAYILAKTTTPLTGGDFAALEPVRLLVNNMETIAASQGVAKTDITLSWSFTTQSITNSLAAVEASAKASDVQVAPTGRTTKDINPQLPGIADVYIGTLKVPYYLQVPSAENPTATLTSYWKGAGGSSLTRLNPMPAKTTDLTIPMMLTLPNTGTMPEAGWPVVIFQHGITRMRTDILGIADAMAQQGFAVVGIDLPLHGAPKTLANGQPNPFHASATPFDEVEPTFDLDFVNNETGAAGPDKIPDASGASFINLRSVLTSRDNVRQGVSNLLTLQRSLSKIPNIDASNVGFIGYSLGGIIGTPYLGTETSSMPSSLVTTGGTITQVLRESNRFGPRILAGLDAAGIKTEAEIAAYFGAAQFISDAADPINYARAAVSKHPIHLIEVVGDGGDNKPDQVVPNSATERLAATMGAKSVSATVADIAIGKAGIVRFIKGNHSSPLNPAAGLDVTKEMQTQLVVFQATKGTTIKITDGNVIK